MIIADQEGFLLPLTDRKDELAKRASIFNISGGIATMFSGYFMSAVTGLAGRQGIAGWQW
jgi:ACS family pantothenate transporter-like MFS transporter